MTVTPLPTDGPVSGRSYPPILPPRPRLPSPREQRTALRLPSRPQGRHPGQGRTGHAVDRTAGGTDGWTGRALRPQGWEDGQAPHTWRETGASSNGAAGACCSPLICGDSLARSAKRSEKLQVPGLD